MSFVGIYWSLQICRLFIIKSCLFVSGSPRTSRGTRKPWTTRRGASRAKGESSLKTMCWLKEWFSIMCHTLNKVSIDLVLIILFSRCNLKKKLSLSLRVILLDILFPLWTIAHSLVNIFTHYIFRFRNCTPLYILKQIHFYWRFLLYSYDSWLSQTLFLLSYFVYCEHYPPKYQGKFCVCKKYTTLCMCGAIAFKLLFFNIGFYGISYCIIVCVLCCCVICIPIKLYVFV